MSFIETEKPIKLDLACGKNVAPGFIGIDQWEGTFADFNFNLETFPWPFDDDSVEEIRCNHYFEHVPGKLRGKFMDEVWRILKKDGKAVFVTPRWDSPRSVQDFTHEWPPICGASYMYFNRDFRKSNQLDYGAYDLKCDFLIELDWEGEDLKTTLWKR